ncbi:L-glutaminase [Mangrovibacterium diazotrophicum]|uniref:L-glutaminase n=2 Tax=Mangrovibacterium diazotrophicum TaxID=1261403 RepID=A0A419W7K7_9BACT|nr:L-glutaminase [Mangrovibacterium diazotrophicum]
MLLILLAVNGFSQTKKSALSNSIRPPAVPLITIDPYTSGWSFADHLYDEPVKHWTGKKFPLLGVIKVDNELYRFMGTEEVELLSIASTSIESGWDGKYVTNEPGENWYQKSFDDSAWNSATGAFGTTQNEPSARTNWDSEYIWVRRHVTLDKNFSGKNVYLEYSHDDDAIIYVNGIEVVNTGNACQKNARIKLSDEMVASLKKGDNLIAGYCYNRVGNGLLDFGLLVEKESKKYFPNTAVQTSVDVQATQTHYAFTCGGVELNLTFTAPLLMEDLDLVSRPVNYISYDVNSTDGKKHNVQLYFEASPNWAVDQPTQETEAESFEKDGLVYLKSGSKTQDVLAKRGDDLRIDWGYFYLVSEKENTAYGIGGESTLRNNFVNSSGKKSKVNGLNDVLSVTRSLGSVSSASGKVMVGYDDIYSIQYFGTNLRPYWNRAEDQTIEGQFAKANNEYESLMTRCAEFDQQMMKQATAAGGKDYAELCALAYRQAIAAHKLVEAPNGDLLFLSKENFSNGSIGTVDVTYPSAPLFLLYNPDLAKGLLNAIFYYSESGKWTKPFAAHDVGTYPLANSQTYGGDMPVEESGNMLILTAAIAAMEGNAEYGARHWNVLTTWVNYLVENGLDPENQLCTDDFAGHFAHNANLSVKATLAIASYSYLAELQGLTTVAAKYKNIAREMATKWEQMANAGDHYRLTFDKPDTWSQKYNLVWDKLMGMDIYPKEIAPKEIQYYLGKQNKYGLPLDNRETYTKTDWIVWTATLADDKATFEKFISPIHLFMNETSDRIPMSDWVFTDSDKHRGFQARSVVGGYFIKMLDGKMTPQTTTSK